MRNMYFIPLEHRLGGYLEADVIVKDANSSPVGNVDYAYINDRIRMLFEIGSDYNLPLGFGHGNFMLWNLGSINTAMTTSTEIEVICLYKNLFSFASIS